MSWVQMRANAFLKRLTGQEDKAANEMYHGGRNTPDEHIRNYRDSADVGSELYRRTNEGRPSPFDHLPTARSRERADHRNPRGRTTTQFAVGQHMRAKQEHVRNDRDYGVRPQDERRMPAGRVHMTVPQGQTGNIPTERIPTLEAAEHGHHWNKWKQDAMQNHPQLRKLV